MRWLLHWLTCGLNTDLCGRRGPPRRRDPPLRPLSPSRPRRLTNSQNTHDQEQSALIASLPAECRVLIWEHVVGREDDTDVLHIATGDGILRYNHCYQREDDSPGFTHHCWTQPWRHSERAVGQPGSYQPEGYRRRAILPLLLTCKLIYTESAHLLYTTNTFDFRRADSLTRLPHIMLPHRLRDIRRIQFSTAFACYENLNNLHKGLAEEHWMLPECLQILPAACEVLASLPGLEYARVTIVMLCQKSRYCLNDERHASRLLKILEHLKIVHVPALIVEISEQLQEMKERLGETPFCLVKREVQIAFDE